MVVKLMDGTGKRFIVIFVTVETFFGDPGAFPGREADPWYENQEEECIECESDERRGFSHKLYLSYESFDLPLERKSPKRHWSVTTNM